MREGKARKEDEIAVKDRITSLSPSFQSLRLCPPFDNIKAMASGELREEEAVEEMAFGMTPCCVVLLKKLHESVDDFIIEPFALIQQTNIAGLQHENLHGQSHSSIAHCLII